MPSSSELLRAMDGDQLGQAIQACPRKLREELFRRCGVRSRSSSFSLKSAAKGARVDRLKEALDQGAEPGDEVAEEVVRAYFYTKRDLLAAALDFLEVPHQEGLTDADIEFMQALEPERSQALMDHLTAQHAEADVRLYFGLMNIPSPARAG